MLAIIRGMARRPYGRLVALLVLVMGSVHHLGGVLTPYMLQHSPALVRAIHDAQRRGKRWGRASTSSAYWGEIARRGSATAAPLQAAGTLLVPLSALWVVS
jgi:hypothetical protein